MKTWHETARDIPVVAEVDVIVCGGGSAGIGAALAASRNRLKVLLIEREAYLGGNATAGLVTHLHGFKNWLPPYDLVIRGIPLEFARRMQARGGVASPKDMENDPFHFIAFDPEIYKLVADDCMVEAGVDLLLYTQIAGPIVVDDIVKGVIVENKGGRAAILSHGVIDCTGDGDIAAAAGVPFVKDPHMQPMTMQFRVGNVRGGPKTDVFPPETQAKLVQLHKEGKVPVFGGPWFLKIREGEFTINATREIVDPTDPWQKTEATIQARHDAWSLFEAFRQIDHDFAQAVMLETAPVLGPRESRRIIGEYVLTGDDAMHSRPFADTVARSAMTIDQHPSDGSVGIHHMPVCVPFGIPYRTLVPQRIDGLLVAGRCLSAERTALASARVAGPAMATGQAAGTAYALAIKRGIQPRAVDGVELHRVLSDQGAVV